MNPQRILRQKLEDMQRAGVTDVSRELLELVSLISARTPPPSSAASTALMPAPQASATPPGTSRTTATSTAPVIRTAPVSSEVEPFPRPSPDRPAEHRRAAIAIAPIERQFLPSSLGDLPKEFSASMTDSRRPCSTLSRDKRVAGLSAIAAQVAACTRCQELAETRTQTVFGVGNPEADIMYIGEAPGADEDREGEPFIGRAGKLLDRITEASKLTRAEIYICNILRCRPPGNRNPTPDEAGHCREYLDAQIETVDPKYIVCWGSVAAHNLLDTKVAIGKLRGKFFDYKGIKVLCTYHPSYLLRSPGAKKDVWEDMKFFRADMGVKLE
ncbi:MAG: uracil-DNA glycosylase [Planctomycetota bacterium]|nr:uracil-DNA glycosylase [Planctomycetota bacterium]MDA1163270.1 uracil-DNA glycosylase [Planctomycetota bacterium]